MRSDWLMSVHWAWPRLGIKGVSCSHSGVEGGREEHGGGGGGGAVVTSSQHTLGGSEASEDVMQVDTTLVGPLVISHACVYAPVQ